MTSNHEIHMRRALALAAKGRGWTSPNPMVGCVLVKNGRVVGEGFHEIYGGPHAEINALRKLKGRATGATAYITLEPCTHWGKTPPCAPAVIESGVKTVYIAMKDPNPIVSGNGIKALKKAGIKVHVGLLQDAAEELNRPYVVWKRHDRPYVTLKMAMTLDGKIATANGDSRWVSGPQARDFVHALRSRVNAVVVGAETAIKDNPLLTAHGAGRDPLRIVLDPHFRTPTHLKLYRDKSAATVVVTSPKISAQKARKLEKQGVQILRLGLKFDKIDMKLFLNFLSKNIVSHLLVEGGGETAWNFVNAGVVDEYLSVVAPSVAGGRDAKTPVEGQGVTWINDACRLRFTSIQTLGSDLLVRAVPAGKGN